MSESCLAGPEAGGWAGGGGKRYYLRNASDEKFRPWLKITIDEKFRQSDFRERCYTPTLAVHLIATAFFVTAPLILFVVIELTCRANIIFIYSP